MSNDYQNAEQLLFEKILSFKYDPVGFVKYVFPWGERLVSILSLERAMSSGKGLSSSSSPSAISSISSASISAATANLIDAMKAADSRTIDAKVIDE
jgi:hypothetical protein